MSYKHFTTIERGCIEALHKIGYSCRDIGKEIGRHHSSVARELERNKDSMVYSASSGDMKYKSRRLNSVSKGKYEPEISKIIQEKLSQTWSPEQISNTVLLGKVSFKTIYNWIYNQKLEKAEKHLRHKGKNRQPEEKRGKIQIGNSIHDRAGSVNDRSEFGHWELDTMVSGRGKSKGCLATFIERKTRLYTAIKITDRTASSMENAIKYLFEVLPKNVFKSATVDRGKEFSCYSEIEKSLKIPMYFADAYSSWQRGSNENSNGLLREFYPKGTDFDSISQQEVLDKLFLINSRPRKCLSWKSAIEAFLHEVSHLT